MENTSFTVGEDEALKHPNRPEEKENGPPAQVKYSFYGCWPPPVKLFLLQGIFQCGVILWCTEGYTGMSSVSWFADWHHDRWTRKGGQSSSHGALRRHEQGRPAQVTIISFKSKNDSMQLPKQMLNEPRLSLSFQVL